VSPNRLNESGAVATARIDHQNNSGANATANRLRPVRLGC